MLTNQGLTWHSMCVLYQVVGDNENSRDANLGFLFTRKMCQPLQNKFQSEKSESLETTTVLGLKTSYFLFYFVTPNLTPQVEYNRKVRQ